MTAELFTLVHTFITFILLMLSIPFGCLLIVWIDYAIYKFTGKSFLLWAEKKIFKYDSSDDY
jgi:hypothetical protein